MKHCNKKRTILTLPFPELKGSCLLHIQKEIDIWDNYKTQAISFRRSEINKIYAIVKT